MFKRNLWSPWLTKAPHLVWFGRFLLLLKKRVCAAHPEHIAHGKICDGTTFAATLAFLAGFVVDRSGRSTVIVEATRALRPPESFVGVQVRFKPSMALPIAEVTGLFACCHFLETSLSLCPSVDGIVAASIAWSRCSRSGPASPVASLMSPH